MSNATRDGVVVTDISSVIESLYTEVKTQKLSNPISLVVKLMEVVEKAGKLTGEQKKQAVILAAKRINDEEDIMLPENLDVLIDGICYVSKLKPKINIDIKSLLSKIKKLFRCKCMNPDIPA